MKSCWLRRTKSVARIARWADVDSDRLVHGQGRSAQASRRSRFRLDVDFAADIVQSCVVTLEPVKSACRARVQPRTPPDAGTAACHKEHRRRPRRSTTTDTEEIDSLRYDLAVPVLEEFALAIDPYPRAPGVEFEPRQTRMRQIAAHPFAALKSLKNRRKAAEKTGLFRLETGSGFLFTPRLVFARPAGWPSASRRCASIRIRPGALRSFPPWRSQKEKPRRRGGTCAGRIMRLAPAGHDECPNCGEQKRPHHVCGSCGHYDGREVAKAKA